jgi:hypothetical protein
VSSREAFWGMMLLYFLDTKEARLKIDQAHWSSVGEVSVHYSVIFKLILGYRSPVEDSLRL